MDHADLGEHIAALFEFYGPQNWWPAESRFEVIVGAILVQNTAWANAERAIGNLRSAGKLRLAALRSTSQAELETLVRPAGFFRQKAATIRRFVGFLDSDHAGSLGRFFAQPTPIARRQLLALKGIGPETADSILLYAGGHPIFVVDAYTRRILQRHRLAPPDTGLGYDNIRTRFEEASKAIPALTPLGSGSPRHPQSQMSRRTFAEPAEQYRELHAMIVRVGSTFCKPAPECANCPLKHLL